MNNISSDSLELHKKNRGKLEIKSKVPLQNRADLSLAYTPGVGAVSSAIGSDKSKVYDYTIKSNSVGIVSDGSAILGLGNLGPEAAIPVMEGKALIMKELANIDAFPICLATQDTEEIIKTIKHIAPIFGAINLEDISAPRCFEIEKRLQRELDIPVMHDDQHGTAVVVLAGLINAMKLRGLEKETARVVVNGVGSAGVAIAKILLAYGFKNIILSDSKGPIHKKRGDLTPEKIELAELTNLDCDHGLDSPLCATGNLESALHGAHIFIGVSKAGILNGEMIKLMAEQPIIFAMANPVPEIMPDEAKRAGAFIVATGRSDFANQVNNSLAFPGIFRGALDHRIKQFTDEMFVKAALNLASYVENPDPEHIIPDPLDRGVVKIVSDAIK